MTDLLTTRQVQDILKVDRITIYRMLQDGRLRGVKVGSQWRFTSTEVERLLSGQSQINEVAADSAAVFPVHCVQTIQNLLSGVSLMSALVLDANGDPVTEFSAQADLSREVINTSDGLTAYQAAWRDFAAQPTDVFVCPAGLHSVAAPISARGATTGWILVGQVFLDAASARNAEKLAIQYGLNAGRIVAATQNTPVVTDGQWKLMKDWAIQAAQAVGSILQERTNFIQRLQQIADLTQLG